MDSSLPKELLHLCAQHGYTLHETQPHIMGERSVMSPKKYVLLGTDGSSGIPVVIKASSQAEERKAMRQEREQRTRLNRLPFAYSVFAVPRDIGWHESRGWSMAVTEFIEQSSSFLERPYEEQLHLLLTGLELQEQVRAATKEHVALIHGTFRFFTSVDYLRRSSQSIERILESESAKHDEWANVLQDAQSLIRHQQPLIEYYGGFLTHRDFVPHNFRVRNGFIYLLDHADLVFGNKYEGWARLCNFLLLYDRSLERSLLAFIQTQRGNEEYDVLHVMRTIRYLELIEYYVNRQKTPNSSSAQLDAARVLFWRDALTHHLERIDLPEERIDAYRHLRDTLRTDEEQKRQKGLH